MYCEINVNVQGNVGKWRKIEKYSNKTKHRENEENIRIIFVKKASKVGSDLHVQKFPLKRLLDSQTTTQFRIDITKENRKQVWLVWQHYLLM